jgi:hypothetical protein
MVLIIALYRTRALIHVLYASSILDARCSMLDATNWSIIAVVCQGVGGWKSEIRNPNSEISVRMGGRIENRVSNIENRAPGGLP